MADDDDKLTEYWTEVTSDRVPDLASLSVEGALTRMTAALRNYLDKLGYKDKTFTLVFDNSSEGHRLRVMCPVLDFTAHNEEPYTVSISQAVSRAYEAVSLLIARETLRRESEADQAEHKVRLQRLIVSDLYDILHVMGVMVPQKTTDVPDKTEGVGV